MIVIIVFNSLSECYQQAESVKNVKRFLEPLNMFNLELNEIPPDILNELKSNDQSDRDNQEQEIDDLGNFKDKRHDPSRRHSSPCSCEYDSNLLDLGPKSYPRFHQQKICKKNFKNINCMFGSKCKE